MSSPPAERIVQIAEAASACGVSFGNCGRSAGNIYTLAGLRSKEYPNKDCLLTTKGCKTYGAVAVYRIPNDLFQEMRKPEYTCTSFGQKCTEIKKEFIKIYRQDSRLINQGWPDKIAKTLKAGDAFWVYSGAPAHTAIFIEWSTTRPGYAKVIEGGPNWKIRTSYRCILNECKDEVFFPIIRTFRPE